MKTLLAAACFATFALAQTKAPAKLSELDQEILKRTEAQIQLIQVKYQQEAQPVIKEHEDIVSKYCKQAGLTPGVDCIVDSQSGTVSKKAAPATVPGKAPEKK